MFGVTKMKKPFATQGCQHWFQDSPHKEHYETFIRDEGGLYAALKTILQSHCLNFPLPEKRVIPRGETTEKSLLVEFHPDRPLVNQKPIKRYKTIWDENSPEGKDVVESLSGYLCVKIPIRVVVSLYEENERGKNKKELKTEQVILTYRDIPILDDKSRFWWGAHGHEIQRIPVGLIRYAPGPMLDKISNKEKEGFISRLLIRGEFGASVGIEIHNGPSSKHIEGRIFCGSYEITIQELLDGLTEDLKTVVLKALGEIPLISKKKQHTKHSSLSELELFNKTISSLYIAETGRKRLENKLKQLLGNDYHLFDNFKPRHAYFLDIRDIAMAIVGILKNHDRINSFLDDKLHLGNRKILLFHHLINKSIHDGIKVAFNNSIPLNPNLPTEQIVDNICNRVAQLLELSTVIAQKRLHKYIKGATQPADNTNPLSLLSQRRKITYCGPGGIKTSYTSKDISIRDLHPSHYGRICIVEANEGKSVGLNLQLASMARIRSNGEIETPYEMPDGRIKWWSAFEEIEHEIEAGKPLRIKFLDDRRRKNLLIHSHIMELGPAQSCSAQDASFIQPYGPAALLVPFIEHCDGTRAMMGAKNMKQALIPERAEAPLIQTGFENLASGNMDSVSMSNLPALGVNALVAYMPWKGFNFEDGIVCSKSFAERMTTVHEKEITCGLFFGDMLVPQSGSAVLQPIGSYVNRNDTIFKILRDYNEGQRTEDILSEFSGILTKVKKISLMHPSVARIRKEPFEIYKATIAQRRSLEMGDKIMGRHGNKGVISLILPDYTMPKLPNGTPIEVILNPNGVISRMNLSQILETHWGWVAYKRKRSRNIPLIFSPFQGPSEKILQNKLKGLYDTDPTGKVLLTYQVDQETVKKSVVVGLQYLMKLNHLAKDKLKIRKTGRYNQLTGGAIKGRGGGQRIGEMEFWALRSYGANAIIAETCKVKNLTGGDKQKRALTSMSLDVILRAMGMVTNIDSRKKASYRLARPDEITSWGPSIESPEARNPVTIMVPSCKRCHKPVIIEPCSDCKKEITLLLNKKGLIEGECSCHSKRLMPWRCECGCATSTKCTYITWKNKKGGLLDQDTFGAREEDMERYLRQFGIIELNIPAFNPLYTINIGRDRDKSIIRGHATYVITKVNGEERLGETNLKNLSAYNSSSNKILTPAEAMCKQFSEDLSGEKLKALNITTLPVVPLAFRDPDGHGYDLHRTYCRIIEINEGLKTTKNLFQFKKLAISLQRAVYELFWGDGTSKNSGLVGRVQGRSGMLRSAMLARRVDFSARAVIVPHPELRLDECILPERMKTFFESNEYKTLSNSPDKRVLIHRAATLHKYNILSFKVKRFWDRDTVGLPPLVCSYMNADFDGDTVAVHLLLSDMTHEEAVSLLSPEKYLLGYANGDLLPHITQDIVLGIYLLAKSYRGRKLIAEKLGLSTREVKPPLTGSKLKKLCEDFVGQNVNNVSAKKLYELSALGFKQATLSGVTFSIFDVPTLPAQKRMATHSTDPDEWRQRVSDQIQTISMELADGPDPNGVAWMIASGARGGKDQIVQLGGMRGSMYRPDGKRIKIPVEGNFREGLKSYEYWISAPGTRKGMIDKHIKTQPAGILHRKLVETGYPLEIVKEDCGTKNSIHVRRDWNIPKGVLLGEAQTIPFSKRILGRTLAAAINLNTGGKRFNITEGREIGYAMAKAIEEERSISEVKVRSTLLCEAKDGVCSKCYGLSLDTLEPQKSGTPVGLIAGHVIGERGVQLAMRTFHTGGATVSKIISGLPWLRGFWGAKRVEIPSYTIRTEGAEVMLNKWDLLLLLLLSNRTINAIEEFDNVTEELSVNEFLSQLIQGDKVRTSTNYSIVFDHLLHVLSFEMLSVYSGKVATTHFETLFRAMLNMDGSFNSIFSQAGRQGSVLASATHDRAIQKIFKAAINNHTDTNIPWREKFIRGLL